MCGRYAIQVDLAQICRDLKLSTTLQEISRNDDVCPGTQQPVIIHDRIGMALWGYPSIKQDAQPIVNIRSEGVDQKPSFANSWSQNRRCLVPVSHFYEWGIGDDGVKHKYRIQPVDQPYMTLAGLWTLREGAPCFAILTQAAVGEATKIHKRFPVVVNKERHEAFFNGDHNEILQIMQISAVHAYEISVC